jgi:transposase
MARMIVCAGIDVSKRWLDLVLWPTLERHRVSRDAAGLADLAAWFTAHEVTRVGLEASGGYEREVIDALEASKFEVCCLNARQVRRFAQAAKGRLAKNDSVDARIVAQFTAVMVDSPPAGRRRDLDPLVEHLTVRRRLRRTIAARRAGFERDLAALDAKLAKLVAANDDWQALVDRLRSVPGVGPVLAQTLIALLPELGRLSRRAVASLVGVAPFDDDSGDHHGERHIDGGRAAVREVLYMAALAAKWHNLVIAGFARRLAGKKPKVIVVACTRKLLVILNAMLRDATDWALKAA